MILELAIVALVALGCAALLTRGVIATAIDGVVARLVARTAAARTGPVPAPARAGHPGVERDADEPSETTESETQPTGSRGASARGSSTGRGATGRGGTGNAEPTLPPRLARRGDAWVVDSRGVGGLSDIAPGFDLVLDETPGAGGGYRVRSLDREGFFRTLGVRTGDVLVALNGRPTTTADEALGALNAARSAPRLTMHFRRGATHYTVSMDVTR